MTTSACPTWAMRLLGGRDPSGDWPKPTRVRDGWQPAEVIEITPETPDTITLRLALTGSRPFQPGQHFNLEIPAGGTYPAVETYSVSSSPWPDHQIIDLTIKEVPGGRISPILVRRIPTGSVIAVEGPLGYFTWNEAHGGPLAPVGAGSGIAPLMSMIRYAAAKNLDIPVHLLYSSKARVNTVFRHELDRLAIEHHWLQVQHTLTADPAEPAGRYHRRIDYEMLKDSFADIAGSCLAYVCGPCSLVADVGQHLLRLGVQPGRLMSEHWG